MTIENLTTFKLNQEYSIICWWEKTRNGFRHLAVLQRNGYEVARDKACYLNRTWERFTYQTVAHGVIDRYFKGDVAGLYKKSVDEQGSESVHNSLRMVGAIASLADILCDRAEDKNKWKERMLRAGLTPGLQIPEGFDQLPEEEKQKRLDGAISVLMEREVIDGQS